MDAAKRKSKAGYFLLGRLVTKREKREEGSFGVKKHLIKRRLHETKEAHIDQEHSNFYIALLERHLVC